MSASRVASDEIMDIETTPKNIRGSKARSRGIRLFAPLRLMQFPARAPSSTAAPAPIVKKRIITASRLVTNRHAWLSNGDRAYCIIVHAVRNKF